MKEELNPLWNILIKIKLYSKDIMYFEAGKIYSSELAMQYTDGYSENVYTFANNINTQEGGTHLSGFRTALTRSINDYGRKYGI